MPSWPCITFPVRSIPRTSSQNSSANKKLGRWLNLCYSGEEIQLPPSRQRGVTERRPIQERCRTYCLSEGQLARRTSKRISTSAHAELILARTNPRVGLNMRPSPRPLPIFDNRGRFHETDLSKQIKHLFPKGTPRLMSYQSD